MKHVNALFFAVFTLLSASAVAQSPVTGGREDTAMLGSQPEPMAAKLYPNPAVEYLNVSFEEPIAKQSKLAVHNIIGNILDVEMETIDDHEVRLRVKDLPVGYYLLAIRDERTNSRITLKFLKR